MRAKRLGSDSIASSIKTGNLLARRVLFVEESTALPMALDGAERSRLGYFTAYSFSQKFSDISTRPSIGPTERTREGLERRLGREKVTPVVIRKSAALGRPASLNASEG